MAKKIKKVAGGEPEKQPDEPIVAEVKGAMPGKVAPAFEFSGPKGDKKFGVCQIVAAGNKVAGFNEFGARITPISDAGSKEAQKAAIAVSRINILIRKRNMR